MQPIMAEKTRTGDMRQLVTMRPQSGNRVDRKWSWTTKPQGPPLDTHFPHFHDSATSWGPSALTHESVGDILIQTTNILIFL